MIPSALVILFPSESNQVKIGVLRIPFRTVAEQSNSNVFPAIGSPVDSIDSDRAVAGTILYTKKVYIHSYTIASCLLLTETVILLSKIPYDVTALHTYSLL